MRRWVNVQLTNGEKTIFGKLSINLKARDIVMANGDVCKKALLRNKRRTIHVKVHFSSEDIIDKVYIRNKCWNVRTKYIDDKERAMRYLKIIKNYSEKPQSKELNCVRRFEIKSTYYGLPCMREINDNFITELPETNSEQSQDENSEQGKKRGRKGK